MPESNISKFKYDNLYECVFQDEEKAIFKQIEIEAGHSVTDTIEAYIRAKRPIYAIGSAVKIQEERLFASFLISNRAHTNHSRFIGVCNKSYFSSSHIDDLTRYIDIRQRKLYEITLFIPDETEKAQAVLSRKNLTPTKEQPFPADLKAGDKIFPICTRIEESEDSEYFFGRTLKAPSFEVTIKANGYDALKEGYMYECVVTSVPDENSKSFTADMVRNCGKASVTPKDTSASVTEKELILYPGETSTISSNETFNTEHTGKKFTFVPFRYIERKDNAPAALPEEPEDSPNGSTERGMTNCLFYHETKAMRHYEPYCDLELDIEQCNAYCEHYSNIYSTRRKH